MIIISIMFYYLYINTFIKQDNIIDHAHQLLNNRILNNRRVQISGERCSGTNYAEQLLRHNFNYLSVSSNAITHKHWIFTPEVIAKADKNNIIVVVWRNPYDWIRSFYSQPHHVAPELKNRGLTHFMTHEWKCIHDSDPISIYYGKEIMEERDPLTGKRFANVWKLRAGKIRHWLEVSRIFPYTYHVKYEDIKSNPMQFLKYFGNKFNIKQNKKYKSIDKVKGYDTHDVYVERKYPDFTQEELDVIHKEIDHHMEALIGYDISR